MRDLYAKKINKLVLQAYCRKKKKSYEHKINIMQR